MDMSNLKKKGSYLGGVRRKVGMYGGKFLPIHMGHVYAMIKASTMVDELHVIVSYDPVAERELCKKGGNIDPIPHNVRLRWWTELTKDLPHVHVHAVYEQQTGHFEDWVKGSEGIKKAVGKTIDTVFSSEHSYTDYFKKLYPGAEHIVIDPDRSTYNISATKIRTEGVMACWDMIPKVVRPYFAKKVVVVGTESCGKSTLVQNLANLFNTTYVEEYGRTYYEKIGGCDGISLIEDYPEIAFEHKYHEKEQLKKANKVLFVDTEAIVTQFFAGAYLNQHLDVLDEVAKLQDYDLWLFLEPDVKWVDDGTRTFGEQELREKNSRQLKMMLKNRGVDFVAIKGDYSERLNTAVDEVTKLLGG
jgi:HTH-type transcriptional regulator, transcriptional repressor of NAD biosynthesis genes